MDEVVVLKGAGGYAEFRVHEIVFGPLERATWFLDEETAQRYLGHAVEMGAVSGVEAATLVICVVPRLVWVQAPDQPPAPTDGPGVSWPERGEFRPHRPGPPRDDVTVLPWQEPPKRKRRA